MRTRFPNRAVFGIILFLIATIVPAKAQSNFVLHTFAPAKYSAAATASTNFDGFNPNGWLTWSGTKFYGTAMNGGTNGAGTIFSLATNGAFTLLYTFPKDTNYNGNVFGANPNGGLVLSGTNLYGTTQNGGANDNGVLFSIVTNGTGITALHTNSAYINTNFLGFYTNADGMNPSAGLVVSGNFLFGTAQNGGSGGNGVVFSCSNRTYKVLHQFTAGNYDGSGTFTNNDGANPICKLLLVGTNLYGTTPYGGTNGFGTLFMVNTNGSNFVVIHHFNDTSGLGDLGATPNAGLVLSGGTLFGIGGSAVYALSTNGANFTVLWSFGDFVDSPPVISGLSVTNGSIYGAASQAGYYGLGQIFAITTNGLSFDDFHDFTPYPTGYPAPPPTNSDGYFPQGGLVLLNNSLYGAAFYGGTNSVNSTVSSSGVIFQASPSPSIASSQMTGTNYFFGVQTFDGLSYTIQQSASLAGPWLQYSNFMGDSTTKYFTVPSTNSQLYFRVRQP